MFLLRIFGEVVFLLCFVDDMGLFGNRKLVAYMKLAIAKFFESTDLGRLFFFVGVKIDENGTLVSASQTAYIQQIIESSKMTDAKAAKAPLPLGYLLCGKQTVLTDKEQSEMVGRPYREVLGSLLHFAGPTRPDISAAVSLLG